ncbi:MAG: FAD binding domain-containing protein [Desulfurococcaceae archaeon]|nr:FAD binding domain-containing protein [Desulfurococcaceae archaeon]
MFDLYRPKDLDDAIRFLASNYPDAMPLAGGTELLILIRDRKIKPPKYLVDLAPLRKQLSYVVVENGYVKIGALTTIWELSNTILHRDIRFAGFRDVWHKFGTIALRFSATIGGNIATATDFSDYIVLLLAYDASVKLTGVNGERVVSLEKLLVNRRKLDLKPGELITEILIPEPPVNASSAFEKFDRRRILIAGLANTASYLHVEGKKILEAKISLDTVGEKRIPERIRILEDLLKGKELSEELIERVIEDLLPRIIKKYTDWWTTAEYRLEMSKVTVKRTLLTVGKRLGVI